MGNKRSILILKNNFRKQSTFEVGLFSLQLTASMLQEVKRGKNEPNFATQQTVGVKWKRRLRRGGGAALHGRRRRHVCIVPLSYKSLPIACSKCAELCFFWSFFFGANLGSTLARQTMIML